MAVTPYEVKVRLEKKGRAPTAGVAKVQPLTSAERAGRALKVFGLSVVMALPCVVVPLLHFVLPPAVLITGTVIAVLRWRQTEVLLSLDAACPTCGAVGKLKASGPVKEGRQLHCDGCGFMADLHLESGLAGGARRLHAGRRGTGCHRVGFGHRAGQDGQLSGPGPTRRRTRENRAPRLEPGATPVL